MKKILAILFVISVFNSVLIAESYITAGSFASFFDNDDRYSPSLITLKAGSDRFFDNGAVFSADLEFMYGFPSSSGLDMLYTNYFNGSTRFLAGYDHKKKIFTGSVTNLSFFSGSDSYSTEVTQGISSFSMKRDSYITEELFVAGSLLDKKFNFLIDLGYKYQQFSKLEDSTGITMNGTFQDNDIFASGYVSYKILSLLAPFAAVRLGHDLNEDPDFNIADIRAGISGDYRLNNSFRLIYQTYYKRLESRIVNENDRVVVNARMRANVVPRFDLFFDGYLEYSFNDGRAFFVNRNISLSGRLWLLEKKLNISSGLTVIFDHHTIYLDDGPQKEKLFVPLWPFLMSELYLFKSGSLLKNFRGFAKFVAKAGEFGKYSNRSFMFNGGFISQIGYMEPYVSFRWNSSGAQTLKTMGIDLGVSGRF